MNREVGMYVRYKPLLSSKYVKINKIKEIEEKENCLHIWLEDKDLITEKYLIKASYNIIDILEKGDYVNGYKVSFKDNDYKPFVQCDYPVQEGTTNHYRFYEEEIYSIVTKEQFSSMEYRLGDDK